MLVQRRNAISLMRGRNEIRSAFGRGRSRREAPSDYAAPILRWCHEHTSTYCGDIDFRGEHPPKCCTETAQKHD